MSLLTVSLRYLTIVIVVTVYTVSCADLGKRPNTHSSNDRDPAGLDGTENFSATIPVQIIDTSSDQPEVLHSDGRYIPFSSMLVNEFAAYRDHQQIDIAGCMASASSSWDAQLARRCYELTQGRDTAEPSGFPVRAAKLWVEISNNDPIAVQQLANAYISSRQYFQALDTMVDADKLGIKVDVAAPALSSVFLYGNDVNALIERYRHHRALDTNNPRLLLGELVLQTRRSEQNYYIGNYQQALRSFDQLLALDNGQKTIDGEKLFFERPYLFRARSLHRIGRDDEAIAGLQKALQHHPDYITLYLELIERHVLQKEYQQADSVAQSLLQHNNSDDTYLEVGRLVAATPITATRKKVTAHFTRQSQDTRLPREQRELALYRLSILADAQKDIDSKQSYLQQIVETPSLVIAATTELATLMVDKNDQSAGEAYFSKARQRWPQLQEQLWLSQVQWLGRNNRSKAIALLNEIIAVNPSESLHYSRGFYYALEGLVPEMERDFKKILDRNPQHINALNAYGYTLVDLTDRVDEGLDMIHRAFALDSERPSIVDSLSWGYYRQGRLQQALVLAHWAYTNLQDPEIGAHYSEILWHLGHTKEARLLLDQELRKSPDNAYLKETFDHLFSQKKEATQQ